MTLTNHVILYKNQKIISAVFRKFNLISAMTSCNTTAYKNSTHKLHIAMAGHSLEQYPRSIQSMGSLKPLLESNLLNKIKE